MEFHDITLQPLRRNNSQPDTDASMLASPIKTLFHLKHAASFTGLDD
jgi:hypothetical protein